MTSTGPQQDDTGDSPQDDQVIRLLASDTRRATLRALQTEPRRSLDDLAAAVADDDHASLDSSEQLRKRLHHCHLPTLDTAGLLQYDTDDLCVEYLGDDMIETVLSALEE